MSAAAAVEQKQVEKEATEISFLINGTSTLAIIMGVASTAAGALALENSRRLKAEIGEERWTETDKTKVKVAAVITALGVLSILLALFWMFKGHRWVKDVWTRRAKKAPPIPAF